MDNAPNASMDFDGRATRLNAIALSTLLGLAVSVITYGICGRMTRMTFRDTTVTAIGPIDN